MHSGNLALRGSRAPELRSSADHNHPQRVNPMKLERLVQASVLACCTAAAVPSISAPQSPGDETRARAEKVAATRAGEMARLCPAADPGDKAAFDACRRALYQDSDFKRSLADYVLWVRPREPRAET